MSTPDNGPRDVVEGGPERAPDGQDEPKRAPRRDDGSAGGREAGQRRSGQNTGNPAGQNDGPPRQGDVPPWYQPESGQPGTGRK